MATVIEPVGYFKGELGGLIWFILFSFPVLNPWDKKMTVTTDKLVRCLVRFFFIAMLNVFTTTDKRHFFLEMT